jgi:hypothetical protein
MGRDEGRKTFTPREDFVLMNAPPINAPLIEAPGFVIQRRISQPLSAVHSGLADRTPLGSSEPFPLADGSLHLSEPFRPLAPWSARQPSPSWRAPARLLTKRGRVVAVVEIEVSMWSHSSTELQLRPVARHPERWSSRRIGRYYALAHLAADETARLLSQRARDARDARVRNAIRAAQSVADPVGSWH